MTIQLVDQSDPKLMGALDEFAQTFEHRAEPSPWPMYMVHNDTGKLIGYFHVCQPALIYPSIHPASTPREVYETTKLILERLQVSVEQVGALTPPNTKFTERVMKKLGFHCTNLLLYTVQPNQ